MKLQTALALLAGLLLVSLGAAAEEAERPALLRFLPTPALGSLPENTATILESTQQRQPAPRLDVWVRTRRTEPPRIALLPSNFFTPTTTHSRLRGPFEQVFPRLW